MNAAEGRAVRHRMFAIVDRSVLTNNPNPSGNVATTGYKDAPTPTASATPTTPGGIMWFAEPLLTPPLPTATAATTVFPYRVGTDKPMPTTPVSDLSLLVPHWAIID